MDTYMELLGAAAQGGVVLLHKVPTNLILGQVAVATVAIGLGGSVLLWSTLVLVLLRKRAVRRGHLCDCA